MFGIRIASRRIVVFLLPLLVTLLVAGCARKGSQFRPEVVSAETGATRMAAITSYSPEDFPDISIPVEMEWKSDESMTVRTASFASAVLKYTGRVEINSLADYFINELAKQGWKLAGSVRSEKVMLAFTKPNKTCTINIADKRFSSTTEVSIYATDDIAARRDFRVPFGEETLK
jgi:hypothetical protein